MESSQPTKAQKIVNGLIASAILATTGAMAHDITVIAVNNPDVLTLKKLTPQFEKDNPGVHVKFVFFEENVLRQRVTTDIATKSGQFDVMMIGAYEAPLWGKRGWLTPMKDLPPDYDVDDLIANVRKALSYDQTLYALPFDAESSMTYYRKDLFSAKGIEMPRHPTYAQIAEFASKIDDRKNGIYGICLRGQPGWGQNIAFIAPMVNSFGGRWFDTNWQAQLESREWHEAIIWYVDLLRKYGPPGATGNGFNENLSLTMDGKCGMWIDSTYAAGLLFDEKQSHVFDKIGFASAPTAVTPNGSHWLWSWGFAIPRTSRYQDEARRFAVWATSKAYIRLVGQSEGWSVAQPGTRKSTYAAAEYQKAAPFAPFVLDAVETADLKKPTKDPVPYTGIQYVGIPEFQSIGTVVGQQIAGALSGQLSVDAALKNSQASASRAVIAAGYVK